MQVAQVLGPSVTACCAEARRQLGLKLKNSRETIRSGGEDGLYRVHLSGAAIVECTVKHHSRTEFIGTYESAH